VIWNKFDDIQPPWQPASHLCYKQAAVKPTYEIIRKQTGIVIHKLKGPFIATQLNSTWRWVELSCIAIDTLTRSRRSELIGDSCSCCERVDNSMLSWVELSCISVAIDTSPTQLNLTRRRVELYRYKRAFRMMCLVWTAYEMETNRSLSAVQFQSQFHDIFQQQY